MQGMASDPDFMTKQASLEHYLKFDSSTTDLSLPIPLEEIDESDARRKRLEDLESEIIASRPPLFGTRDARKYEAKIFMKWGATPRADYPVAKDYNWPYGDKLWTREARNETWLGITWVALQYRGLLCIVLRNKDLVDLEKELVESRRGKPLLGFPEIFWTTIVSNVEDAKEQVFQSSSVQSFSVVSVGAASKGQEALREAMKLAEKTSMFLFEKLQSDPSLTSDETVQTAILATQYLFEQEFEAEELRVFLWDKEQFIAEEVLQKRPENLKIEDIDLEEILACLNGSDNDDSGMQDAKRRRLGAAAQCS